MEEVKLFSLGSSMQHKVSFQVPIPLIPEFSSLAVSWYFEVLAPIPTPGILIPVIPMKDLKIRTGMRRVVFDLPLTLAHR